MTSREALVAINPATGLTVGHYPVLDADEIGASVTGCHRAQKAWEIVGFEQRAELLQRLGDQLEDQREYLARLITGEMGKPLAQAEAEIDKCAWV